MKKNSANFNKKSKNLINNNYLPKQTIPTLSWILTKNQKSLRMVFASSSCTIIHVHEAEIVLIRMTSLKVGPAFPFSRDIAKRAMIAILVISRNLKKKIHSVRII